MAAAQLSSTLAFKRRKNNRNRLRDKFPAVGFGATTTTPLTHQGLALVDGLLAPDPTKRTTAEAAATHAYFSESPLATPRHLMELRVHKHREPDAPVDDPYAKTPPAPEGRL